MQLIIVSLDLLFCWTQQCIPTLYEIFIILGHNVFENSIYARCEKYVEGLKIMDLTSLRVKNKFFPTRTITKAMFVKDSKFSEVSISIPILLALLSSKYDLVQS